jgi:hypothetical protein
LLPIYAIFKADRESSDGDSEAKNSLQQAVKDAQAALQDKITALEKDIQDSVLDVAQRTLINYVKWHQNLPVNLLRDLRRNPSGPSISPLMGKMESPSISDSGIRRLSLLNFSGLRLRRMSWGRRNVIYTIEEPETSQHPNYQIMLMKALPHSRPAAPPYYRHTHVPAHAG